MVYAHSESESCSWGCFQSLSVDLASIQRAKSGTWHVGNEVEGQPQW